MRRTSMKNAKCPIARSLDVVGDWWTLLIVREALKGARRFGEFQQSLGTAKNILSTRLREMVANGILEARPAEDGASHNEYHLTEAGLHLQTVLVSLRQWSEQFIFEPGEPMMVAVDRQTERPIRRLEVVSQDGRLLDPLDIVAREGEAQGHQGRRHRRVVRRTAD